MHSKTSSNKKVNIQWDQHEMIRIWTESLENLPPYFPCMTWLDVHEAKKVALHITFSDCTLLTTKLQTCNKLQIPKSLGKQWLNMTLQAPVLQASHMHTHTKWPCPPHSSQGAPSPLRPAPNRKLTPFFPPTPWLLLACKLKLCFQKPTEAQEEKRTQPCTTIAKLTVTIYRLTCCSAGMPYT